MMLFKTVRPSPSYRLELPENICEQVDEHISSFWLNGEPILLQLSSYIRDHGLQIKAQTRLRERIKKHHEHWSEWGEKIHPDTAIDQATAEFNDDKGLLWIHSYLVWPHLTVYSIISVPKNIAFKPSNWALQSLRTLSLTFH